jgi:hypothetical protein
MNHDYLNYEIILQSKIMDILGKFNNKNLIKIINSKINIFITLNKNEVVAYKLMDNKNTLKGFTWNYQL